MVVPHPQNGSSTTSPGLLDALIIRSRSICGLCVGYPNRSCACELIGEMSVQTFPSRRPGISSKYRLSCGRLSLLSAYEMRPSASNLAIVSLEYRQPIVGDL